MAYVELPDNPTWSGIAYYIGPNKKENSDSIIQLKLPQNYVQTHTNVKDIELGKLIAKYFKLNDLYKDPVLMPKINVLAFTNDGSMGASMASEDARQWVKDSSTNISFNNTDHQNTPVPASITAYRTLTESIKDKEFVSEIQEAFSCYFHEEFLACALVLSRSLECICILLLNTKDENIYLNMDIGQQTLNGLINALFRNNLIDGYERSILKAAASYRNSVNHQTPVTEFHKVINNIFDGIRLVANKILNSHNN